MNIRKNGHPLRRATDRRGRRQPPVFSGDPGGDWDLSALLETAPLPAWDGATFDGAAGTQPPGDGMFRDAAPAPGYRPALPPGMTAGRAPGRRPVPPLTVVSVTVGDRTEPGDRAAARWHAALTYIRLKVAILEESGHADRIDESERARLRGDPLPPRSDVAAIRREAAMLLCGGPS